MKRKCNTGFTLLEILIALFIFTIISLILVGALHLVIDAQNRTAINAERLRGLQKALLVMSRDVEQTINRPSLDTLGGEEATFTGSPRGFTFIHGGAANALNSQSALQRAGYYWNENSLLRMSWPVVDQAPQTQATSKALLTEVTIASFQYLDKDGQFHHSWPVEEQADQPLPRAIRVKLTLANWGEITQLYIIPAKVSKATQMSPSAGAETKEPDRAKS